MHDKYYMKYIPIYLIKNIPVYIIKYIPIYPIKCTRIYLIKYIPMYSNKMHSYTHISVPSPPPSYHYSILFHHIINFPLYDYSEEKCLINTT